jgi:hypothetical protein
VKIRGVAFNNRRRDFEVRAGRHTYRYPYARLDVRPGRGDAVVEAGPDAELGGEAFSYRTAAGHAGTVHIEQVLDYNRDPGYVREMLLYQLAIEAQRRLAGCVLSRRELARRLRTSPAQRYRLLDQTNTRKSVDQMLALLAALDCDIDLRVKPRRTSLRTLRRLPRPGMAASAAT